MNVMGFPSALVIAEQRQKSHPMPMSPFWSHLITLQTQELELPLGRAGLSLLQPPGHVLAVERDHCPPLGLRGGSRQDATASPDILHKIIYISSNLKLQLVSSSGQN